MAERKRFLLRLDPAVYAAMERWAGDSLRSVNAQIEYALRQALDDAGRPVERVRRPASGARDADAPPPDPDTTGG